ncbi:unnamed protein product [Amoebophrya sp. A120]|nr:unnamed protein product [Amoebophrya sp. A120]|eukprot:GSA120T00022705001.1
MQFTPQQLVGGSRFSNRTRLGNWSEDTDLDQLKLKDYLMKKEEGDLLVNAKQKKLEAALGPVTLTPAPEDKIIKFGSTVMLVNHKSEAFLSVNPFETVPKEEVCRPVTTSMNAAPCNRNTFIITRARQNDGFGDSDVLHYGQDFCLRLESFGAITVPHFLQSEAITPLAASKFSRKQEVVMFPSQGGKCLFQMCWPDVKQRFEMEGQAVACDAPLCIRHVHTGSFLASDKIVYQNIFGPEFEVHCHNYVSTNKTQNLCSEQKGMITGILKLVSIHCFLDATSRTRSRVSCTCKCGCPGLASVPPMKQLQG